MRAKTIHTKRRQWINSMLTARVSAQVIDNEPYANFQLAHCHRFSSR
jgi:hypothetical protein